MEDEQINRSGIDQDEAILREEEDLLNRQRLADRVADLINNPRYNKKNSVVIGIEGEWGEGKTSLINLALNKVRLNDKNLVIEFNPWNFSNQNELITDFFNSISEGLDESLAKKIMGYALKLLEHTELEVTPSITFALLVFSITVRLKGRLKFHGENEKPLKQQRDEIVEGFKKLEKRIVIVIDDIDRLDCAETKLIFKLVKLTSNFPNTVFILAYDRVRVGKRLTEETAQGRDTVIEGEEYLKKIIQQPFLVPKPDPKDIENILHNAINGELALVNFKGSEEEIKQLRKIVYTPGFRNFFQTIRDIKRYINSLRLDLRIIGEEEINMGDFLGTEAIRVFAPEMYLAMSDKEPFFTGVIPIWEYDKDEKMWLEKCKKTSEEIVKKAPEEIRGAIKELIPQLFPCHGNTYMSGWDVTWRKELRVCSPNHFDKYFRLAILASRISEAQVNKFLSITDNPAVITERLGEFHENGKFYLLLERLYDRLDSLDILRLENLLVGIFDFIDNLQEPPSSEARIFSNMRSAISLVIKALEQLEDSERSGFLERLLNRVKNFLVTTRLTRALDEISQDDKEPLLTKDGMVPANSVWLKKIKVAAQDGSLGKSDRLLEALSYWKHIGKGKDVEAYIMELLSSKEGLFDFLKGIMGYTTSFGEYTATTTRRIPKKTIEHFNVGEILERQVGALDESTLTEEEKGIVEMYRNRSDDWIGETMGELKDRMYESLDKGENPMYPA